MNIRTTFDPKPIPTRDHDWSAITSEYEPGHPIGYGATEAAAVADLIDQDALEHAVIVREMAGRVS